MYIHSHGWTYDVHDGCAWDIYPSRVLFDKYPDPYKECKTLYVPPEINYHCRRTFYSVFPNLQELIASPLSQTYETHDGVLCRHGTVVYIPHGKKSFYIDKNITAVDYGVFDYCHNLEVITMDSENTAFKVVDGCLYNSDMTKLYFIPYAKKSYHIPNTVTYIDKFVLKNVNLESLSADIENQIFSVEDGVLVENNKIIYILPKKTTLSVSAEINSIECSLYGIEKIVVAPENENYMAVDDCLFDKSGEKLICFPNNRKRLTVFLHTKLSKENQKYLDNTEWDITVIVEKNKHLTMNISPKKLNSYLHIIRSGKTDIKPGTEYLFLNLFLSGMLQDEQSRLNFKKSTMLILCRIILDDNIETMKDVLNKTDMVTEKNIRKLVKFAKAEQKTNMEKLLFAYLGLI